MRKQVLWILGALWLFAAGSWAHVGSARAQECDAGTWSVTDLGPIQKGVGTGPGAKGEVVVSADGEAWAQVVQTRKSPSSFDFYLNGTKKGSYEQVLPGTLRFGADASHWSLVVGAGVMMKAVISGRESEPYEGIGEAGVVFSPNGKRHAFSAGMDGKQAMVVDWAPGALFDAVTPPIWSDDGTHLAYVALVGTEQWVVMDGAVIGKHSEVLEMPAFSADSVHMAYAATTAGKSELVVDGKVVLTGDPALGACPVLGPKEWLCVVNGPKGAQVARGAYIGPVPEANWANYEAVMPGSVTPSPVGERWGFVVSEKGRQKLVVGDLASEWYDKTLWPVMFSPDGRHVTAVYERAGSVYVWFDGKALGPYDTVSEVGFMPQESGIWFVAMKGQKVGLTDGTGATAEWVEGLSAPVFCKPAKSAAWVLLKEGQYYVSRDNVVKARSLEAMADSTLAYSSDCTVLAVVGKNQGQAAGWANGCVSPPLEGVAMMGQKALVFHEGKYPVLVGRQQDRMLKLTFQPK